jgi:hypothetical protein
LPVREYIAGHRGKAERVVEFPVREQAADRARANGGAGEAKEPIELAQGPIGLRLPPFLVQ